MTDHYTAYGVVYQHTLSVHLAPIELVLQLLYIGQISHHSDAIRYIAMQLMHDIGGELSPFLCCERPNCSPPGRPSWVEQNMLTSICFHA